MLTVLTLLDCVNSQQLQDNSEKHKNRSPRGFGET